MAANNTRSVAVAEKADFTYTAYDVQFSGRIQPPTVWCVE